MSEQILNKHMLNPNHECSVYSEDRKLYAIALKSRCSHGVLRVGFNVSITHGTPNRSYTFYRKNTSETEELIQALLSQINIGKTHFFGRYTATFHHYGILSKQLGCPVDKLITPKCFEFPEHCGFSSSKDPEKIVQALLHNRDLMITQETMIELARMLEEELQGEFPGSPKEYKHLKALKAKPGD